MLPVLEEFYTPGGRGACRGAAAWRGPFRPSRCRRLLPLGLLVGLGQRIRRAELVLLLGDLGVDRRLGVGVAELLLDELQVSAALPVQVGRVGGPAGVR